MSNSNYLGLPENVKFCKSCVISNQRPSSVIEFKNKENTKNQLSILIMKESVVRVNISI